MMTARRILAYLAYAPFYLGLLMLFLPSVITVVGEGIFHWYRAAAIFCTFGLLVPNRSDRPLAILGLATSVVMMLGHLWPR